MSSPTPSRRDASKRLEQASPPAWVLRHTACVEALALAMADAATSTGLTVDRNLVQVGAVLHDVGRSITQEPRHAYEGAQLLRGDDAWPEEVIRIVERHTGGGLGPTDAARIGIPAADYSPRTLEERIVSHADNLYSGDKRLTLAQLEGKYLAKGLPDAWSKIAAMHDTLAAELRMSGAQLESLPPAPVTSES